MKKKEVKERSPRKEKKKQKKDKKKRPSIQSTNDEEMILHLDNMGRHRSEWCYAPYDGRLRKTRLKVGINV